MRLRKTTVEYAPIARYDGTLSSLQKVSGVLPAGVEWPRRRRRPRGRRGRRGGSSNLAAV